MHLKRCGAQLALERESDGRLEREMGAGGVPQHKREVGVESVLEREEGEESEMGVERENVEILESLEEEAIMGEDKGRTPSDYNRRAHLFDRSSNAFRALKQRHGK
ncbi:hypothetical protein AMTR_s00077p00115650 [Amborella trichopoda]|uniref:Uncharacterized protein n=1 Tax=Amborella trichopoda TaxID=13333 RepID=W1P2Y4_AMBTC|nr:hypothetical protein AMTR_s00077p00115650 [Amborella trichopoda]